MTEPSRAGFRPSWELGVPDPGRLITFRAPWSGHSRGGPHVRSGWCETAHVPQGSSLPAHVLQPFGLWVSRNQEGGS